MLQTNLEHINTKEELQELLILSAHILHARRSFYFFHIPQFLSVYFINYLIFILNESVNLTNDQLKLLHSWLQ